MIIAKLKGGLGNQMFIYAFARHLAFKNNTELKLDLSYYKKYHRRYALNNFNIIEDMATEDEIKKLKIFKLKHNKLINFLKCKVCKRDPKLIPAESYVLDSNIYFKPEYLDLPENVYLEGLFQTEKYFKDIKDIIKKEFSFKKEISGENLYFANQIKKFNSVSLHIRRGDYITNPWAKTNLGIVSLDYYLKAIKLMEEKINNPHFFIFSDDIEWVKENLKINSPFFIVNCNDQENGFEDMRLMSLCDHYIVANSSFSWWGAWLGNNSGKVVIAPHKWFNSTIFNDKDVVPDGWLRL